MSSFDRFRFLRFVAVGATCFVLNLVILHLCVEILGLHYLVAMLVSIVIVYSVGWILNRRWTFISRDRAIAREYGRYVVANLATMLLSLVAMWILVSLLEIHYLLASALIAIVMALVNFIMHGVWTFAKILQEDRS